MAINSMAILTALPYLPQDVRVMSRCANAFDHGYKITMSCYERLTKIIATTPRLQSDLINHYGADEDKVQLIPNGISPKIFQDVSPRHYGTDEKIRLGFLGRLEHDQKGVLFLPEIIHNLDRIGVDFTFEIVGKGVHKKALERELDKYIKDGRVRFIGPLVPSAVVEFLGSVDVFVFVSQFEGCPNALLEGMMAGCVPVTFQIEGITDFIVKDGVSGFVCPMADCDFFAARISDLFKNKALLKDMAAAAVADARARFSDTRAASEYAFLIKDIMQNPPPLWIPLTWSSFKPDLAFVNNRTWRSIFPKPIKRAMKNWLFNVGLSNRYYE